MTRVFDKEEIKKLYRPDNDSSGEDNGQVTIIGGSALFHGAPLFSLKVASRIVDMVFFSSPEKSMGSIAEAIKSKLNSFVWTPWEDLEKYIEKSDSVLIGPGMMSFRSENDRSIFEDTKKITKDLLTKFVGKKWVIDAGALQVMEPEWIPENSILTPNKKEFKILFGDIPIEEAAKKYKCIIVLKGLTTIVADGNEIVEVVGGNAGLTKGGTGDVEAGITVALLAKNEALLSAMSGSYITKMAGEDLYKRVGTFFSADDLSEQIPTTLHKIITS